MNENRHDDASEIRSAFSSELWRKIIDAASDYETHLQSGLESTPEAFASKYTDIPSEILTPELHRLWDEIHSSDSTSLDPNLPKVAEPRFVELELLRTGGMGEIYRGMDRDCNRPVAIKKIRKEYQNDEQIRSRFRAEAELTASLEHPGIIPIYGQGIDAQGRDYYAMRLIIGKGSGTFSESIRKFHERAFSNSVEETGQLRDLIRRLVDIVDTIAYAHSQNIAHRDLKPSNILIGPYGETLIADWGLARKISPSRTSDQGILSGLASEPNLEESLPTPGVGTPGYAAPESSLGVTDQRLRSGDIYSLGAILSCILKNHPPRRKENQADGSQDPIILKSIPGILALEAIAQKATAIDWVDRYKSVDDFRSDLLDWLAGEPVSARPENWWEKAVRWPSRHRTTATGVATGLAITLVGGASFMVFQSQQKQLVIEQANRLQMALDDSSRLLKETQKANEIAETRRVEAVNNRQIAERRESLAFDGLLKFQDLIVTNQEIFQSPELGKLNGTLSNQSKKVFEAILKDLKQDSSPSPDSVSRLAHVTRRLASMDLSLKKEQQSNEHIDQACNWMRQSLENSNKLGQLSGATEEMLHLKIGELRLVQGSLAMGLGKFQEARPRFDEAIQEIQPLIETGKLSPDQLESAKLSLAEAWSGASMYEAYHGQLSEAKRLQKKALEQIGENRPTSGEEAQIRMQIHGNMSILLERSGEPIEALKQLKLAAKAVEEAFGMIDQNPAGFAEEDAVVLPTKELMGLRSRLGHEQVRIMISQQDVQAAIGVLEDLAKKENDSIRQNTINATILDFYEKTTSNLQLLLAGVGKTQRAIEVAQDWIELAKAVSVLPTAREPQWLFLIDANHTAGHLYQQLGRNTQAQEMYTEAITGCQEAFKRDFRTASILSHKIELHMHLFELLLQSNPFRDVVSQFEQAVESTQELTKLNEPNRDRLQVAIDQLKRGLDLMLAAGFENEATEWTKEIKSRGLLK
ncbi:MAG: serine/threonine-protein kinase [Planctomycetota bacterium]